MDKYWLISGRKVSNKVQSGMQMLLVLNKLQDVSLDSQKHGPRIRRCFSWLFPVSIDTVGNKDWEQIQLGMNLSNAGASRFATLDTNIRRKRCYLAEQNIAKIYSN